MTTQHDKPDSPARVVDKLVETRAVGLFLVLAVSVLTGLGWLVKPRAGQSELDKAFAQDEHARGVGELLLLVDGPNLFTAENVRALLRVMRRLEALDTVSTPLGSLSTWLPNDIDDWPPGKGTADPLAKVLLNRLQDYLTGESGGPSPFLSRDGRALLIPLILADLTPDEERLAVEEIRRVARAAAASSDLRVRLTGGLPLGLAIRDALDREQIRFLIIGYSLTTVMALLLFRGWRPAVIAGLPPLVGVVWSLGILRWVQLSDNPLTKVVMPIMLTMVAFTDTVHLLVHIRRYRAHGVVPREAAKSALRRLLTPCFLTSLTTAIGFASLLLAESQIIREFGLACSIAVLFTFLAVVLLVPLLSTTWLGATLDRSHAGDLVERFLPFFRRSIRSIVKYHRPIIWLSSLACALLIGLGTQLKPDRHAADLLPQNSEAYQALAYCDVHFGGISPVHVTLRWDESIGSALLASAAESVHDILEKEPLLGAPFSYWNAGAPAVLRASPWIELLYDEQQRRAVITARARDLGFAAYLPVFERIEARLEALNRRNPAIRAELGGGPVRVAHTLHQMVVDLLRSLGTAFVIIVVVMGLVYRSLRIGLITVLPNLFPLATTASLLVLTGRALTIDAVCAFTICLGIGVDDTIHMLSRYRLERGEGFPRTQAIERSFLAIAAALLITTVVMVSGFSVLLLGQIPAHQSFGAMACTTLISALIADLVILPALLERFAGEKAPPLQGGRTE